MAASAIRCCPGAGAACARRDTQIQSGIQASPSTPATAKAWRHPLRSAIQVASSGAGRVGQAEGAADQTVLRVGKVELAHQHGRQRGQRGAVQVVDRGGEHEDRQHPPAVARSLVNLGAGLVHWNCHWNSMVATSPAVASLALAFGKYSTVILRPFCTPQPNDASPLPAYITFDGSATSNLTSLCAASSMVRRACCLGRQSTCLSVPLTLPSGCGPSHHGTGLPATAAPSLYLASAL